MGTEKQTDDLWEEIKACKTEQELGEVMKRIRAKYDLSENIDQAGKLKSRAASIDNSSCMLGKATLLSFYATVAGWRLQEIKELEDVRI